MSRDLALDAYRYVCRNYKDNAAQNRKMERKHGAAWNRAVIVAGQTVYHHGIEMCAAAIVDRIEQALSGVDA